MKKIVSIGAGTGQAAILKGLVRMPDTKITALVTTTDNGGSSALIRESLDIPSPGDVRNVINAINPNNDIFSSLLNYRFNEGELTGTHLGNLIVGALSKICGSYEAGILHLNTVLGLPAYVLPVSNHPAQICAELEDGTIIQGERQIIKRTKQHVPIKKYFLSQRHHAVQDGLQALTEADMIIVCPGVLGTGIISTLLFDGMYEAIKNSPAQLVYIANVMTYPSETDGFTLSDHVHILEQYTGRQIDIIIANSTPPPAHILTQYAHTHSYPIVIDKERLTGYTLLLKDLLIDYTTTTESNELVRSAATHQFVGAHRIRHDGEKVRTLIEQLR